MKSNSLLLNDDRVLIRNNKAFLAFVVGLSVLLVFIYSYVQDPIPFFVAGCIIMAFAVTYSFYITFAMFFVLVMGPAMLFLHASVLFTPILFISFLFSYQGNIRDGFKMPLLKPIFIYMLACIPSFVNSPQPLIGIRDSYNLVAFVLVIVMVRVSMKTPKIITYIFYAFIAGVFIHSVIVDYVCLQTGQRYFGLMNVFYIDFAALAAIYSLLFFFYGKGYKKILWITVFSIILLGLILTQTRNAWISFGAAAGFLLIFLFFKYDKFKLKRKLLISTFLSFVLVAIVSLFIVLYLNPNFGRRFELESKSISKEKLDDIFGQSSLATRLLIWDTCYNAFVAHPVFGIGAYTFKHTSAYYYTIPKNLYKFFVENKTPHQTFIEVITETGIFGLVFFLYFIFCLIRYIVRCLKLKQGNENGLRTLLITWSFVYIIISMLMTEAWLYGQLLMWFGILLGLSSNNTDIINATDKEAAC